MSHKLAYQDSPKDNLKTWALMQKIVLWGSILSSGTLLALYLAFMY